VSRVHLVGGEKGGVGKSVVARVLAQWFVDHNAPFAAIDADRSHGVLVRSYGEYTQAVDLGANESADQILDRALGAERRVLVDLPGQSAHALRTWLSDADILHFASEMGVAFTYWHVVDGGYASVSELERALGYFGQQVQHVLVKNFGRGNDFGALDQSDPKRRLDELNGRVIEIPALQTSSMYAIDHGGLSFWAAIHVSEGQYALGPLDRQRVRLWLDRCYAAVASVEDIV